MEQEKIDRINALARRAKETGLTPEEEAERAALRAEYVAAVKASLTAQLERTYLVDADGRKTRLKKRGHAAGNGGKKE